MKGRPYKVHHYTTMHGPSRRPIRCNTEGHGWVSTIDPKKVTCLICRYHLGLHKPQGQLRFPKQRKGCSAPGKGWKM